MNYKSVCSSFLVAVIFFLAIAFTAYAGSISKTQTQEKEFEKIKILMKINEKTEK